jgi:hypothetical protein
LAGAQQYSVGTTPTLLASAPAVGVGPAGVGPVGWFQFANGTAATVYINGGTTVSSSNGYPLGTSATTVAPNVLTGWLFSGDALYGIVSSGSSTVDVLVTGV